MRFLVTGTDIPFVGITKRMRLYIMVAVRVRMRSGASHLYTARLLDENDALAANFSRFKTTKETNDVSASAWGSHVFGGTPRTITYLRQNHLLATAMASTR